MPVLLLVAGITRSTYMEWMNRVFALNPHAIQVQGVDLTALVAGGVQEQQRN